MKSSHLGSCSLITVAILSCGMAALRADTTWQGAGSDFNTAGNWTSGAPTATSAANFTGSTPKAIAVSGTAPALGLNFTGSGYSFTGTTIFVGGNGVDAAASLGTISFANPVTFTGSSSVSDIGAGTTVDISGQFNLTGNAAATYEKAGDGTLTLSGSGTGSVFGPLTPASTRILVSSGVLNLNKTITAATNVGNPEYLGVSGNGTVNVQQASQFGSTGYRFALRLSGTGQVNFAAGLGTDARLAGVASGSNYAISFGTDISGTGAPTTGGGSITIGAGTTISPEDIRYQGTTQATISGSGILAMRAADRVISVSDAAGVYKELVISTQLDTAGGATTNTLTKSGNGTLVLSASNAMNFALVRVSAGTLLINNIAGSGVGASGVEVSGSATLGGTGFIVSGSNESVTLLTNAILSPGDVNTSTGVTEIESLNLTFSGSTGKLDLTADAKYIFDLGADTTAGVTYDTLVVSGTTAFSSSTLDFSDFTFVQKAGFGEGLYTLLTSTSLTGVSGVIGGGAIGSYSGTLSVVGNSLVLNVVPEPKAWLLLGLGAITTFALVRRRATANKA